jgi:hypothetical protein
MVGFSFVQSANDVAHLQDELAKRRPDWRENDREGTSGA